MKKRFFNVILSFFLSTLLNSYCFSKNANPVVERSRSTDSLLNILQTTTQDTTKVKTYNNLFLEYEFIDDEKAKEYLNKAIDLSKKIDYKVGLAVTYKRFGYFTENKGSYPEALKYFTASLNIQKSIGDKIGEAGSYNGIGNVYEEQGNYTEALKNYLAALKIYEALNDKEGEGDSYMNVGLIYYDQGNYPEALKNHFTSLKIRQDINDKIGISKSFNNIGLVYFKQGDYQEALKNYFASLKIKESMGDKKGIAKSFNNIGSVYGQLGNGGEALKNHLAALQNYESLGYKAGIAISLFNVGYDFFEQKQYEKAETYFIKSIELSKEIGYKKYLKNAYSGLSELDSAKGDFKGAYENHKLYILYRDSLDNEETRKKTIQSQMNYEFEKKEAITKLEQEKKDVTHAAQSKQQRLVIYSVIMGLFIVLIFAFLLLKRFRVTQKQKNIIELQKQEVEQQKQLVEEKNHEISSSISYAKRIQNSFLTSETYIKRHVADYFVLYKPKDIVSGDFYWMHKQNNYFYFCIADCTGHGIPGAFMSLIGMGILNEIIYSKQISDTNNILDELRRIVIMAVNQEGATEEGKDGMDLVLGRLNLQTKKLQYSAANNSFYICQKGELVEYKPDKMPVGSFGEYEKPFTQHTIQLEEDDIIYAITDGYADQFGGPNGKKFKYKQLEEQLIANRDQAMEDQKKNLEHSFDNWKGDLEQVDDVTVVGIKI